MFEPSKEQRHIKEVCLNQAVLLHNPICHDIEDTVEAAGQFEAFFYTDPDTNKEKEE